MFFLPKYLQVRKQMAQCKQLQTLLKRFYANCSYFNTQIIYNESDFKTSSTETSKTVRP